MIRKNKTIKSIVSFSLALALLLGSNIPAEAKHNNRKHKDKTPKYTTEKIFDNNRGSKNNNDSKSDKGSKGDKSSKKGSSTSTIFVPDKPTIRTIADIQKLPDANKNDPIEKTAFIMTNDTHGAIDGFAYIPDLERLLKSKGYDVVIIDCGDYSEGSDAVESSDGIAALKIMKACGYDVGILGNHEFDVNYKDGNRFLITDRIKLADFPILSANVTDGKSGKSLADHNYVYISPETNMKIGFFGLDTGETSEKNHLSTSQGQGEDLKVLIRQDLIDRAQLEVDDLRNTNGTEIDKEKNPTVDFVVCLAHLGVEDKRQGTDSSVDVYAGTEGIDLLLDANSHDEMTSGPNGAPIVSTGSKFANIGVILIDNNRDETTNEFHPVITDKFLIDKKDYQKNLDEDDTIKTLIKQAKNGEFDDLAKAINAGNETNEEDEEDTSVVNTLDEQAVVDETVVDETMETPQTETPTVEDDAEVEQTTDAPSLEENTDVQPDTEATTDDVVENAEEN